MTLSGREKESESQRERVCLTVYRLYSCPEIDFKSEEINQATKEKRYTFSSQN